MAGRYLSMVLIVANLVGFAMPAPALTIRRTFIGGAATTDGGGGGNLFDIFNAAADRWESSILDEHTLDLDFGWSDLPGRALGLTSRITPIFSRPARATILFDNNTFSWFLDPTPHDDEEYLTYLDPTFDLGGGAINIGRVFTDPTPVAAGRFDLLTAAIHEIGHALGFHRFMPRYADPIRLTTPRPFPGTAIPTTIAGGGHIDGPAIGPVMASTLSSNTRKIISDVDILAVAEVSDFDEIVLDPRGTRGMPIPEPVTATLALMGFTIVATRGRRLRLFDGPPA